MAKIRILQGAYGARDGGGRVHPVFKGECTVVSEREAMRLARLGVAEIVSDAPTAPPVPPSGGHEPSGPAVDTPGDEPPENGPAGGEKANQDSTDVSRLERLPKDDLVQMAQDMGVDISGAKNNHERAELIAAAMSEEDGDVPPELEDEDIVR